MDDTLYPEDRSRLEAVSYTHLDVYKRQTVHLSEAVYYLEQGAEESLRFNPEWVAVSYTHLVQEYRNDLTFYTNGRSVCLTELKGYQIASGTTPFRNAPPCSLWIYPICSKASKS